MDGDQIPRNSRSLKSVHRLQDQLQQTLSLTQRRSHQRGTERATSVSTQAPDELVLKSVHRLQDQLQQTLSLTQRRSHQRGTERATSVSKGNDAYAAMEAVIMAREWQADAKRANDQKFVEATKAEENYHDAIRRTLEKTEALEKHVKTVTMRADSLVTNEADFF